MLGTTGGDSNGPTDGGGSGASATAALTHSSAGKTVNTTRSDIGRVGGPLNVGSNPTPPGPTANGSPPVGPPPCSVSVAVEKRCWYGLGTRTVLGVSLTEWLR